MKNRIIENYRDTSIYGNKSAADALRYEKVTGILLSNKGHIEKCEKEYRALRKNIENGFFSDNDKNIATKIMNDLTDALGYIPDKVNIPINKF